MNFLRFFLRNEIHTALVLLLEHFLPSPLLCISHQEWDLGFWIHIGSTDLVVTRKDKVAWLSTSGQCQTTCGRPWQASTLVFLEMKSSRAFSMLFILQWRNKLLLIASLERLFTGQRQQVYDFDYGVSWTSIHSCLDFYVCNTDSTMSHSFLIGQMNKSKIDLIGLCCVRLKYLEIPWLNLLLCISRNQLSPV